MTAAGRGARRTVMTAASVIPAFCRILITASVCVKWPVPVPQKAATNRFASTFDSSMPATVTTDLRLFARPFATLSTTFSTGLFHKLGILGALGIERRCRHGESVTRNQNLRLGNRNANTAVPRS